MTNLTIRAKHNRNGNESRQMQNTLEAAASAALTYYKALREVQADVLHGRNYQTVENGDDIGREDRETCAAVQLDVSRNHDIIISAIADLIRARNNL
jgi:hypothetical protein